jgi:hypothetical protein
MGRVGEYAAISSMACRAASEKPQASKACMEYPEGAFRIGSQQLISRAVVNPAVVNPAVVNPAVVNPEETGG